MNSILLASGCLVLGSLALLASWIEIRSAPPCGDPTCPFCHPEKK